MDYISDRLEGLLTEYVRGMIHEIEYLKEVKVLVTDRLEWHKDENAKIKALLEA